MAENWHAAARAAIVHRSQMQRLIACESRARCRYCLREVGGGRTARQPGQVRKEATVTSFARGVCPASHLPLGAMNELSPPEPPSPYRVLARKYRPTTFAELIGQDALVRTLTNAIKTGRIAHAFILTGVRGIGKTTTARILARALNCVGPERTG